MSEYKFANVEKAIKRKQAEAIIPEEPVWEGRWKIVIFKVDGSTIHGALRFKTESDTLTKIQENEKLIYGIGGISLDNLGGIIVWKKDYSHAIPMPIREGGE